jgi:hypothetical protein
MVLDAEEGTCPSRKRACVWQRCVAMLIDAASRAPRHAMPDAIVEFLRARVFRCQRFPEIVYGIPRQITNDYNNHMIIF